MMRVARRLRLIPTDRVTPADKVDPLVRSKGAEIGVRTEIIPNLESSLSLWELKLDSELLFVGDAGTTEPSRPSKRTGIEWTNHYRPYSWLLVDLDLSVSKTRVLPTKIRPATTFPVRSRKWHRSALPSILWGPGMACCNTATSARVR